MLVFSHKKGINLNCSFYSIIDLDYHYVSNSTIQMLRKANLGFLALWYFKKQELSHTQISNMIWEMKNVKE